MDPITTIKPYKDSSFAMLLEAQTRGYELYYFEQDWLYSDLHASYSHSLKLSVQDTPDNWFSFGDEQEIALVELDIILMRKDPPFNLNYIYSSYFLEKAEQAGTIVVNSPSALRNYNEKMSLTQFPDCAPKTLVSGSIKRIRAFLDQETDIIVKPLDGMGGSSIFRIQHNDPNTNVILETITVNQTTPVMAQSYIPEITEGDKRVLLIDGVPVPYALARIPSKDDHRGNLASGGSAEGVPLTDREYEICKQVGPALKKAGVMFAGIDIIGGYLTEINITSPTCIRELDKIYDLNISATLFDAIEAKLEKR